MYLILEVSVDVSGNIGSGVETQDTDVDQESCMNSAKQVKTRFSLVAYTQLYESLCQSVCQSVRQSRSAKTKKKVIYLVSLPLPKSFRVRIMIRITIWRS